jgi:hypothetical protein
VSSTLTSPAVRKDHRDPVLRIAVLTESLLFYFLCILARPVYMDASDRNVSGFVQVDMQVELCNHCVTFNFTASR